MRFSGDASKPLTTARSLVRLRPMMPDKETLARFKGLYEKEFKVEIDDQEAYERFSRLVNVLRIMVGGKSSNP